MSLLLSSRGRSTVLRAILTDAYVSFIDQFIHHATFRKLPLEVTAMLSSRRNLIQISEPKAKDVWMVSFSSGWAVHFPVFSFKGVQMSLCSGQALDWHCLEQYLTKEGVGFQHIKRRIDSRAY